MSNGLRDLRIWQDAVALAGDVVRVMRQHSRRETKVVSDAVMLTALSVGAHVADGYARYSADDQRDSYMLAKRALLRLESELAVARHAELLPAANLNEFAVRCTQLTRMLTGFLVYLDRQISEREAPVRSSSPAATPPALSPGSAHAPS